MYHQTKDGRRILLSDLEDSHLKNIIAMIERKAKEGITIIIAGGGVGADDIWYDEDTIFGKEALERLNYKHYINELKKRNNDTGRKTKAKQNQIPTSFAGKKARLQPEYKKQNNLPQTRQAHY
ncbi:MAG: hypothetical protein [Podoviridae sp. ctrTa16]|nr:MAG: hypothetical protein [Podoviridae sp. ctrTa16]